MNRFAVELSQVVRAPRSRVYRAFLEPDLVARWLAPGGSVVATATVDERVGGVHRVEMLDEHGDAHMFDSVIQELVEDERIVLIFKFGPDAEETLLTVTLRDAPGGGHRGVAGSPARPAQGAALRAVGRHRLEFRAGQARRSCS